MQELAALRDSAVPFVPVRQKPLESVYVWEWNKPMPSCLLSSFLPFQLALHLAAHGIAPSWLRSLCVSYRFS